MTVQLNNSKVAPAPRLVQPTKKHYPYVLSTLSHSDLSHTLSFLSAKDINSLTTTGKPIHSRTTYNSSLSIAKPK